MRATFSSLVLVAVALASTPFFSMSASPIVVSATPATSTASATPTLERRDGRMMPPAYLAKRSESSGASSAKLERRSPQYGGRYVGPWGYTVGRSNGLQPGYGSSRRHFLHKRSLSADAASEAAPRLQRRHSVSAYGPPRRPYHHRHYPQRFSRRADNEAETASHHRLQRRWGNQGWGNQGWGNQGWGNQGWGNQGWGNQGWGNQGRGNQGWGNQGWGNQGWSNQGRGGQAQSWGSSRQGSQWGSRRYG